jgi:hypothetical protein
MITYRQFKPTQFDTHIDMEEREEWLVIPCGHNRDSDCLTESNFYSALSMLGGESETVEIHRFGHWGPGWFEILLVDPNSPAATIAQQIEDSLEGYPVLDEDDYCCRENEAACETWANCYNDRERIAYMRKNWDQFNFHSFADMLGCARGNYFAGYASELLG